MKDRCVLPVNIFSQTPIYDDLMGESVNFPRTTWQWTSDPHFRTTAVRSMFVSLLQGERFGAESCCDGDEWSSETGQLTTNFYFVKILLLKGHM